jgi:hypothetical protein
MDPDFATPSRAPPDHVVAGFANRRYRFDLSHEGTDFLDRDIL